MDIWYQPTIFFFSYSYDNRKCRKCSIPHALQHCGILWGSMWILSPEFNFICKIVPCIKAASYEDSYWRPKLNRWAINNPCTLCAQSCDYNCSCIHSWRISHHLLTKDPGHHSGLGNMSRSGNVFCLCITNPWSDFLWGHTNESAGPPVSAAASVCSVSLVIFGDIAQSWHVFHISPQALWSAGWRVGAVWDRNGRAWTQRDRQKLAVRNSVGILDSV